MDTEAKSKFHDINKLKTKCKNLENALAMMVWEFVNWVNLAEEEIELPFLVKTNGYIQRKEATAGEVKVFLKQTEEVKEEKQEHSRQIYFNFEL